MLQNWHIRSRAHACAQTEVPFEDGQPMITAIYFDAETGGYLRRDISLDAWEKETTERKAIAHWRTAYSPTITETKPEVASKEGALALLQRFIEEDEPATENARYILALMLERKRTLIPTATKEVDGIKMLFYENKKAEKSSSSATPNSASTNSHNSRMKSPCSSASEAPPPTPPKPSA
jgi:hypothetical protein